MGALWALFLNRRRRACISPCGRLLIEAPLGMYAASGASGFACLPDIRLIRIRNRIGLRRGCPKSGTDAGAVERSSGEVDMNGNDVRLLVHRTREASEACAHKHRLALAVRHFLNYHAISHGKVNKRVR
jgi:hypothetical protein